MERRSMTEARWNTSKLGSWRSSPSSSRHPLFCCCSKRRRRLTIGRTTAAALIRRSPKATRMTGPQAKPALLATRAPLATSPRAKNRPVRPATGPSKKRRATAIAIARRDQTRRNLGRRTPFGWLRALVGSRYLVAIKGVMVHTGRTQAMVRTPIAPRTRTTTPVMDPRHRTAAVAARVGRARDVSVMPTTSSRPDKLRTPPITTTATSATETAASARPIRLTPDVSRRRLRRAARCRRAVSSHRGPHGSCHPTRYCPSHRSTGRLHGSRSRSYAPVPTPRCCLEPGAARWASGQRVSV